MPAPVFSAEERSATIAEMTAAAGGNEPAAAPAAAPAPHPGAPMPAEMMDPAPEPSPEPNTDNEPTEPDAAAPEPDDAPEEESGSEVDPQTAKNLDALQKARKREDDRLAAERAAFQKERDEYRRQREADRRRDEEYDAFVRAKERAAVDPAAWLKFGGISDEDLGVASRKAFWESPEGQELAKKDPKLRPSVEAEHRARLQKRDADEQHKGLKSEVETLKSEISALKAERWLDGVVSKVSAETPHVSNMLGKDRARAMSAINSTAAHLWKESGIEPKPQEVIEFLEKTLGDEAEMLGYQRLSPKTKPKPQNAGETKAATKTLSNNLATRTQPKSRPLTPAEERLETIREMEEAARMA